MGQRVQPGAEVHLRVRDLSVGYPSATAAPSGGRRGSGAGFCGGGRAASGPPPVLQGVDFTLRPGEHIAFVGRSGSGKTTLLHALAGLLRPQGGCIEVDGVCVASPSLGCSTQHAAYMFQHDLLLPWKTVRANAAMAALAGRSRPRGVSRSVFREEIEAGAETVLTEFGLGAVLDAYPHQLSGGMRQRVALARTLILGRRLLLLDEPFVGLDCLTRSELQVWMLEVMKRHPTTWALVTHDIREAVSLAERVAVLGGRPAGILGWVETAGEEAKAVSEVERLLRPNESARCG